MTRQRSINPQLDPRFVAGVQLLERAGARMFRLGHSGDDDGPPTVWHAVAMWDDHHGEAAASLSPVEAVMRLCEQVIDGGQCTHCKRPTIFVADTDTRLLDDLGCVIRLGPRASHVPTLLRRRRAMTTDRMSGVAVGGGPGHAPTAGAPPTTRRPVVGRRLRRGWAGAR